MAKVTEEQVKILERVLPDWAVKTNNDPRKKGMSVITPQYVIETLNEVFGFGGWTVEHEIMQTNDVWCVVKGCLVLNIGTDKEFRTPLTYGGNDNKDAGDRMKGAVTDLMTKSAQFIHIANSVFRGEYVGGELKVNKLDVATELVKTALPNSLVLTEEHKEMLRWYVQHWLNSKDYMLGACAKYGLDVPKSFEEPELKKWAFGNRIKLIEIHKEVSDE